MTSVHRIRKTMWLTAHIYSLEDAKGDFVLKEVATKNLEVSVAVSPLDSNIKAIAQLIMLPLAGWGSKQGWDWFKNRKRAASNTVESSPLPAIPPAEEEAPRQAA